MEHSIRRINRLARELGAKSYLEIGVNHGNTFRRIEIDRRSGVDVNFLFDASSLIDDRTALHNMTSDDFFASHGMEDRFDIIFIDGLHVFEQVVRDFANAVCRAHQSSVIILDDTMPSDVYSSLRDDRQAHHFRHLTGNLSSSWHGDVYKAVAYIHDFWPSINYRTVVGSGNEQTICWFSNLYRRKPRFNNLETISRLSFFEYVNELGVIMPKDEDSTLRLCVGEILGRRRASSASTTELAGAPPLTPDIAILDGSPVQARDGIEEGHQALSESAEANTSQVDGTPGEPDDLLHQDKNWWRLERNSEV
jgi:hypothetical protein